MADRQSDDIYLRKIACGIEYDGTGYRGFQRQASEHGPTVQGVLEAAIARISGSFHTVYGAGRTDAGVHASGQVIHFRTGSQMQPLVWLPALNANLPGEVAVRWCREVPEHVHARYSARSRAYRYTIWNDPVPSPLHRYYSLHFPKPLDADLMNQACTLLPGNRDFGAFGSSPGENNPLRPGPHSRVRTMLEATCIRQGRLIYCDFAANAFLTGMVRRMVGTLLLVGQKRINLEEFATIVRLTEKTHIGAAVPAHGLCLVRVQYPEEFRVQSLIDGRAE